MKKWLCILLSVLLLFTLSACGDDKGENATVTLSRTEMEAIAWPCFIPLDEIADFVIADYRIHPYHFSGYLITLDHELYEYNLTERFDDIQQHIRKIETEKQPLMLYYNGYTTTDGYFFASADNYDNNFAGHFNNDDGYIRGAYYKLDPLPAGYTILSNLYVCDKQNSIYRYDIHIDENRNNTILTAQYAIKETPVGTIPRDETPILFANSGAIIKTDKAYYDYRSNDGFVKNEKLTSAYNDILLISLRNAYHIIFKDDSDTIYRCDQWLM